jgi:putative ATP-grasp target RiPP
MTRVLDPISSQLPAEQPTPVVAEPASLYRPLVMRLAAVPAQVATVDMAALAWDERTQMMVMSGTLSPAWKHTSTQTSTSTGEQDRKGADSDTDSTGT